MLGWVLANQRDDLARAIDLLQAAVAERPKNAEIRWHCAVALEESGLSKQAVSPLYKLLSGEQQFAEIACRCSCPIEAAREFMMFSSRFTLGVLVRLTVFMSTGRW